jgi:hypothetical protein
MARVSRPPGFDMTYRPEGSVTFGPPIKDRLPAFLYLGFAVAVLGVIVYGQNAPSNSVLFQYVVVEDSRRALPAMTCALILVVSAFAAVLRTQMRGVVVHPDGIVIRELLALGWPRVKKLHWSQIDRLFVPAAAPAVTTRVDEAPVTSKDASAGTARSIRLDLWDGSHARLPPVADLMGLAVMLEKVALARAIPVEGTTGLIDDLGNPMLDDASS